MIAPIARSSLLARGAVAPRAALASASVSALPRRTIITKAEKWSHDDIANALESPESKVVLSEVVPHIEARWAHMSKVEQYGVYRQLEELQRKPWVELSLDEKKAAYFVAFGPHGPRKPILKPGQAMKTLIGVSMCVGTTAIIFYGLRSAAPPPPKTMTKEWQEKTNELAKERNINPITGISAEDNKGKGFVQSK